MNYQGKYGKYYEIPDVIKLYMFSSDGEKVLEGDVPMGFVVNNIRIPDSMDAKQVEKQIRDAITQIETDLGSRSSLDYLEIKNNNLYFRVFDPLGLIFENMQIPKTDAKRVHESGLDAWRTVRELLTLHYDEDTLVKAYNNDFYVLEAPVADIMNYLPHFQMLKVEKYFDDCYTDHEVTIWVNGDCLSGKISDELEVYGYLPNSKKYKIK